MESIFDNYLTNSVIIIAILLQALYLYLTRNDNYWSKLGIRGPKPIPGFGTLLYEVITGKQILESQWIEKYGKVYGAFDGSTPFLRVADPVLIKDIMVKDFHMFTDRHPEPERHQLFKTRNLIVLGGDAWKRVRAIVSPTFTSGKMKRMYPQIKECLTDFIHALDGYAMSGKDVNIKQMYGCLTLDVIATCAFATKVKTYDNPDHPFRVRAEKTFKPNKYIIILSSIAPAFLLRLMLRADTNKKYFYDILRKIIAERKSGAHEYNDFIELIMKSEVNGNDLERDVNDVNEAHHVNEGKEEIDVERKTFSNVNRYITEEEMIASAHAFLLAGYETTATALSHCTQELAMNPQIQERLYEEVMSAVDARGHIEYDVLARLPYLDSVLSETLRLHSPAFQIRRRATSDYRLGNTGITIKKGQKVEICNYGMHRMEEYYPKPLEFNPDRFMPENRHKLIPYTYLPFGAGPRYCVAMRFALLEAKTALAQVVSRYKIVRTTGTEVPVRYVNTVVQNMPARVVVGIVKRI